MPNPLYDKVKQRTSADLTLHTTSTIHGPLQNVNIIPIILIMLAGYSILIRD
jgi:hypothetical protein